uniref:Uncharacterized protein n=1 Tax=Meloidogyne enterolobii TaxID=390850 RepID=A0A6V7XFI1_MELEN|nr:unnamed protein product [Meloidogyne enterolobii]
MRVLIFDLEKLREFRKSELTGARYNAQLFTFDGLTPGNWFAFRIEYRLVFSLDKNGENKNKDSSSEIKELATKQELIVRTKTENKDDENFAPNDKLDSSEEIADELVKFERIQLFPELHQLNVSVIPSIKQNDLISTLIVAELRCARGTVKPPAQQVPNKGTVLSFDLKRIHPGMLNYWNALNHLKCVEFCVFPFIRVGHTTTLINTTSIEEKRKTNLKYIFRARELCELMLEERPKKEKTNFKEEQQRRQMEESKLLERHFRSSNNSQIIKIKLILIFIFCFFIQFLYYKI